MRPTARYVSACLSEYIIHQVGVMWKISRYQGGDLPVHIKGVYTTFAECERALCQYLGSKDKRNRAIYPNSPYVNKVNDA